MLHKKYSFKIKENRKGQQGKKTIWNIQKIKNKMSGVNAAISITLNVNGLNNSIERKRLSD